MSSDVARLRLPPRQDDVVVRCRACDDALVQPRPQRRLDTSVAIKKPLVQSARGGNATSLTFDVCKLCMCDVCAGCMCDVCAGTGDP